MRQVRLKVNAYEKALVFRNGQLVQVLDSGRYWISPWSRVMKYDVTELFYHEIDIDLLMKCEDFKTRMNVVEIADSEIAIQYKSGYFNQVLSTGKYAYWKDGLEYTYNRVDLDEIEMDESIPRGILHRPELKRYYSTHIVAPYEVGLLYVEGNLYKELGPGTYYYWNGTRDVVLSKVDTRKQQVEVSGQELLTLDKAAIRMSLFANYQVVDVVKALTESRDYAKQLYVALQLGLREYVGQYTLDQLLKVRDRSLHLDIC